MLLGGEVFDGAAVYYDANRRLRAWGAAGSVDRYLEFVPAPSRSWRTMAAFLHSLYVYGLCYFLTGSFVNYVAGAFDRYGMAFLVVAMGDGPIYNMLFHRTHLPHFNLGPFELRLINANEAGDTYDYILGFGVFRIILSVVGIDSRSPCGPRSDVDFVHFVWEHINVFLHKKYALTYLPDHTDSPTSRPRLVFLRHHRVLVTAGGYPRGVRSARWRPRVL